MIQHQEARRPKIGSGHVEIKIFAIIRSRNAGYCKNNNYKSIFFPLRRDIKTNENANPMYKVKNFSMKCYESS